MILGYVILGTLSGLALISAFALASRARFESGSEMLLATSTLWHGLIVGPIYALGWAGQLTPAFLALTVAGCSLLALAASAYGRGVRAQLAAVSRDAQATAAGAAGVFALAWRKRSLVLVGLTIAVGCLFYTAWLSYLAPSAGWDGIWYHETMVGYAIQNRGFKLLDLPPTLQYVNAFPRVCESMNLWFVIFTDRKLIEAVNSVMGMPLLLAMYALGRRYSPDRLSCAGWAAALLLMPGVVLQLRSTYIDLHVAALFVVTLYFCTKPVLRIRDGWLVALSLGLLLGSKGMALVWAPCMALVAVIRLVFQNMRQRPVAVALTVFGGALVASAFSTPFYLRNWLEFDNPLWPMSFVNKTLNIEWKGVYNQLDMNKPFAQLLRDICSVPNPGADFHDTRTYGYGLGVPFVVMPLALVGLVIAFPLAVVAVFVRPLRRHRPGNLVITAALVLITAPLSPALWSARYNLQIPAVLMIVVVWLAALLRSRSLSEGAAVANIAAGVMMLYWADPGWMVTFDQAKLLATMKRSQRVGFEAANYASSRAFMLAREAELSAGDILAFPEEYVFGSVFWNERFSNKVQFVSAEGGPDQFVKNVLAANAEWVVVMGAGNSLQVALLARPEQWQVVGLASMLPESVAFRRIGR